MVLQPCIGFGIFVILREYLRCLIWKFVVLNYFKHNLQLHLNQSLIIFRTCFCHVLQIFLLIGWLVHQYTSHYIYLRKTPTRIKHFEKFWSWAPYQAIIVIGLIYPPLSNIVYLVYFRSLWGNYNCTREWGTHIEVICHLLHVHA